MIRMLAWCGTNRSTSSGLQPARATAARAVDASVRVAKRYVSRPSIRILCSPREMVSGDDGLFEPPAGSQIM